MKTNLTNIRQLLKWKLFASFSMLLFFSGCVEFEGQTLTYRYDRENDRLLCFQVYENIHGNSQADKGKPPDKYPSVGIDERNQLESVMKDQRTFFFDNFGFEYGREVFLREKEKTAKELQTADLSEKPSIERYQRLIDTILDSVVIKNGDFYLNDRKQLCGYQYVTVSNVSKMVSGINEAWRSRIQTDLKKTDAVDEADWIEIQKALDAKEWVQMQGNQFRVRLVSFNADSPECEEGEPICAIENNFDVHYRKPFTEIVVGQKNQAITQLVAPPSFEIRTNLMEYVRDTYGIKKRVPITRLREEFLRTGSIPK